MLVSGFTFIRNGIKYDYPFTESLHSLLPLVDELVVVVGLSEDNTRQEIEKINSAKIKIIDSVWDDHLRTGGQVLAIETNKALDAISSRADWAFYIQADEVLHEEDYEIIRQAMQDYLTDRQVEGLLFNYIHFYGSYRFYGDSRRWYRKEVRIIRNDKRIRSWRDAQGFRIQGRKLRVKSIPARIFHYGWVKPPHIQQSKQQVFHRWWHDDKWIRKHVGQQSQFDYSRVDSVAEFTGTHPSVMHSRISQSTWQVNVNPYQKNLSFKDRLLYWIEKQTGVRLWEYRNYKEL
jgi:glycosyltransferase involved in cell wall biosynthesis